MKESLLKKELAMKGFEWIAASAAGTNQLQVEANKLQPVLEEGKDPVFVTLPVSLIISVNKKGHIQSIGENGISPEILTDAVNFAKTLVANHQLDGYQAQAIPGATHAIEVNEYGQKIIRRKRFSAY